jgi:CDP-diacylglycerol--glycerol-3-phosphate 3-phosphatidyltransferase
MLMTPFFAGFLAFESLAAKYTALCIFVLATLTDWYDGYLARKSGDITATGKYLDPLADKLLVSTAFGVFCYLGYVQLWMVVLIISRDILITGLRAYALSKGKLFETSSLAKWKTACQMVAIYVLFIWLLASETYPTKETQPALLQDAEESNFIWSMMFLVTLYTVATGVSYLLENRRHLKSLAIAFYRVFVPTNVR